MKSDYNFNLFEKKDYSPNGVKTVLLLLLAIGIIALPLNRASAQSAPTLSYSSPQTYLLNTAITPLVPTSTGVAAPAYSTTAVTVNTGLTSPFGVATDAAGNLYVSDLAAKIVKEFPAGGGTPVIIGSGEFTHPEGIAVDAAGNVYAAGDYNGHVTEILKSDGSAVSSGTGFNEFSGVAVDAQGNVYVADFGNNNPVKEILKSNGNTITVGTGFSNYVIAVATDAAGNVYVADTHNNVSEILASNGSTISLGSGFNNPQGVAVDALGNVFVSDQGSGSIKEIPVGSNTPITLVSGLTNPGQIAVDGAGNIYFVDTTTGTVQEITPVGGYYISALPQGLSFSNSTGTISGTVTANVPPTNYIVTAYNVNGGATYAVNITVGTPPVPTLSYPPGPKTYTTGAAIFPLTPASTGVSPPGYSGTKITVGTGYNDDQAVTTDAAGNIYVTDQYNNAVKKIPAGGGSQVTVASNLTGGLYGVAVDAAGNLYVSENSNNAVLKIPAGGGTPVSIGTGFKGPDGLAVDAAGNVYVADVLNNAIKKILASDGSTVTLASGLGNGYGVAVDAAGNVYVAATYNNAVMKLPAGGGSPVSIGSGFNTPEGVAVDAIGNVYVSDFGSKSIKMITPDGNTTTIATNFSYPQGLAVDGAGNVFIADAGTNSVYKIKPTGGYFINSALPLGLTFKAATGVISGTPLLASAAKDYTVTSYNVTGSATAVVNLKIVAPVTITSITRQYATLTNTYYAAYNVVFSGAVTGLKPSNFSVTTSGLTGASVNSVTGSGNTYNVVAFTGSGDGTVILNLDNDLGVEPGVSTTLPFAGDSYTIDKTPPSASPLTFSSDNANAAIANIGNTVSLVFGSSEAIQAPVVTIGGHSVTAVSTGTNAYKASYTMTASDAYGRVHFTLSMTDLAGNTSTYDDVAAGDDIEFVKVAGSGNVIAGIQLSPAASLTNTLFTASENDYTTSVTAATSSITVTTTPQDPTATVTVNGIAVANGVVSQPITLNAAGGQPTIVTVVASLGGSSKSYVIAVSRNGSSDVNAAVKLNPAASLTGTLYTAAEYDYTTSVAAATSSITVTTTPDDPASTVTVNGVAVANGVASQPITLNAAGGQPTIVTSLITSPSGYTRKYVVNVSRNGSSNVAADIKVSPAASLTGTLFTASENDYSTSVAVATSSITVTATPVDPASTVTINGVAVANGVASQPITLNAAGGQPTIVTSLVTSPSGYTRKYVITVNRNGSSDVIAAIKLSPAASLTGTLYTAAENDYTSSVAAATSSITITTTPDDPASTVTVNGVAVANGVASQPIALNVAGGQPTIVTSAVTSVTGFSKLYVIAVSRPAVAGSALVSATEIPPGVLAETDGIVVHNAVSPNGDGVDDFLRIEGIAAYPTNKLTIINRSGNLVYEAKGYDNNARMFDGHSNKTGALQLPGTYFYSLEYMVDNIVKHKTGFIVLKY